MEILKELFIVSLATMLVIILGFASFCIKHDRQSKKSKNEKLHNS